MRRLFAGYLTADNEPALRIEVGIDPGLRQPPPPGVMPGDPWLTVRYEDQNMHVNRVDLSGHLNLTTRQGMLTCQRASLSVDAFLRVCFSTILVADGGLLLHASSIASGTNGFAFCGPSGAGKTTVARLADGRTVLTDETTIVRPENGGFRVWGSPFPGELGIRGPNRSVPLKGVFGLAQDIQTRLEPLSTAAGIGEVLQNVMLFGHDTDLGGLALETACSLVRSVPTGRLHFTPDGRFWEVLAC